MLDSAVLNGSHHSLFCRCAAWLAFSSPVQKSLDEFRANHNAHRIRKQTGVDLPTGYSPDVMWQNPALFKTGMLSNAWLHDIVCTSCQHVFYFIPVNYLQPLEATEAGDFTDDDDNTEPMVVSDELREKARSGHKDNCVLIYKELINTLVQ